MPCTFEILLKIPHPFHLTPAHTLGSGALCVLSAQIARRQEQGLKQWCL